MADLAQKTRHNALGLLLGAGHHGAFALYFGAGGAYALCDSAVAKTELQSREEMDESFWAVVRRSVARNFLPSVALVMVIVFLLVGVVLMLRLDTSVPVSNTDVEATARANERLLQIVQWTLTTVLGLGVGFIAFNWFQSTRDRADIAEIERRLKASTEEFEKHVDRLTLRADEIALGLAREEIRREVSSAMHEGKDSDSLSSYIRLFRDRNGDRIHKQAAAEGIVLLAKSGGYILSEHAALHEIIPELQEFDPDLAAEAALTIAQYPRAIAPQRPQ